MPVILTLELMKKLYPKISDRQAKAFVDKQSVMAEILAYPERAALAFANMQVETAGFDPNNPAIRNLTENTNYTPERMAVVWSNRFLGNPQNVIARYGADANWRRRAFNDIYGKRMGNRPGTDDGFNFIGRGGPQITGRDGYQEMTKRIGKDFLNNPQLATQPELQPDIVAAFWAWKRLSSFTKGGVDIAGARTAWNGGHNGLDVVKASYPRMLAAIKAHKPETAAMNVQPATSDIDATLRGFQADLIALGYFEIGEEDGRIGGKTLGAIRAFYQDRGITERAVYPSGVLADHIRDAMDDRDANGKPWHRPIAPTRAFATEKELAPKVASIAPAQSASMWQKITAWFSGGATLVGGAVKVMPDANDQVSPYWYMLQQFFPSIPQLIFFAIVAAVAIYTVRKINQSNKATVDDYQRGKIN